MRMEPLFVSNLCSSKKKSCVYASFPLSMATRFLTLGAATIISCLLISLGMYQYRQAKQLSNAVNRRMIELSAWIEGEEVTQYDGVLMSGAEVVNFYKRFFTNVQELPEFCMVIEQDNMRRVLASGEFLEELQTEDSVLYCPNQAVYQCSVIRNQNGVITEVCFVKKES